MVAKICSNLFDNDGDNSSIGVQCIADWHLTADQLLVSLYSFGGLFVCAALWVSISKFQQKRLQKGEVGFSRLVRGRLVVSSLILVTFSVRLATYTVTSWSFHVLSGLYAIGFIDAVARFLAARFKLVYIFSPYVILDVVCISSHIVLGYGNTRLIDGVETRTWLDFSPLRAVFIYRSFVEMERYFPRSTKTWMILRLFAKSMLVIIFAAGVIFILETLGELPFFDNNGFAHLYQCSNGDLVKLEDDCADVSLGESWSIMFAFYFTVVTLTTVGYGDIAPSTILARLLVIIFIVAGIVKFSMEIENWISIYNLRGKGNAAFEIQSNRVHVVVMGNPSYAQLSGMLTELSHEDHVASFGQSCKLHAVVLGQKKANYTKQLIHKLNKNPEYSREVTYVIGDPVNPRDLDRALLKEAAAGFFLSNKHATDANEEDYQNCLRVLAVKRYAGPSFRCLVMLLRAENMRHILAAGVHLDDIVCEDTLRMGVIAQSCISPGYSTILANIAACLSYEKKLPQEAVRNGTFSHLISKVKAKKAARLSNLVNERPWYASINNDCPFKREYIEGAARELYVVVLAKDYLNLTFADAALKAFQASEGTVILMGCEVSLEDVEPLDVQGTIETNSRVLLNPGHGIRITPSVKVYVLADDVESVIGFGISSPAHFEQASVISMDSDSDSVQNVEGITPYTLDDGEAALLASSGSQNVSDYESISKDESKSGIGNVTMASPLEKIAYEYRSQYDRQYSRNDPIEPVVFGGLIYNPNWDFLPKPPLDVLRNPAHIVVCSFLHGTSMHSLQHFVSPLRGAFTTSHPPITILNDAEQTPEFSRIMSKFRDVYYVRGSPLVYRELQRAGAKSAHAVVILAKKCTSSRSKETSNKNTHGSVVDSEAIFATMLVELKLQVNRFFCITELSDQLNSRFFENQRIRILTPTQDGETELSKLAARRTIFKRMLKSEDDTEAPDHSIFNLRRYMAGRLFHSQLCENILVQSFYNPNIHRAIRQLIGGPLSTGCVLMYNLPNLAKPLETYGQLFEHFNQSAKTGICLGLFRSANAGAKLLTLPVVLTAPSANFKLCPNDKVYILIGWHVLEKHALQIQRVFRGHRSRSL